jgi:hypothetical protein
MPVRCNKLIFIEYSYLSTRKPNNHDIWRDESDRPTQVLPLPALRPLHARSVSSTLDFALFWSASTSFYSWAQPSHPLPQIPHVIRMALEPVGLQIS